MWNLLISLKDNLSKDYLTLVAGGIGFYFLLATFPAVGAVVSIYGLFSDPAEITAQIQSMSEILPQDVLNIVISQAQKISAESGKALSFSLLFSIALTVYSTSKGMKAIIQGIGLAYDEDHRRKFISLNLVSYGLTFLMVIYFIIALSMIAGLPAFFQLAHVPDYISGLLLGLRWPVLFVFAVVGLEIVYFFAPTKHVRKWNWYSYGSVSASLIWLIGSSLFSLFVARFYNFNEVYGSLGAGVALLFWFWLSALTILAGAEINATLAAWNKDKNRTDNSEFPA